jgi:mono/diheme cytochrome c family protein
MSHSTPSSPRNRSPNVALLGRGCALLTVGVLGTLVLVLAVWGPTLLAQLAGTSSVPTALPTNNPLPTQVAEQLASYGWVDESAGRARIPIARAMALAAEQGLPVGVPVSASDTTAEPAPGAVDLSNLTYNKDILPIFQQRCSECHGDEKQEEGLKLTTYRAALGGSQNGPVIEPGEPDSSYLVELIVKGSMPKRADPLPQHEIDMIIAWIAAGVPEGEAEPTPAPTTPAEQRKVSFQADVLPIFQQRCGECHGDEEQEEGLKLTSYRAALGGSQNGTVIEPGDPDSSYLVKLIVEGAMPKRADPLPQHEIDTIIAWIAAGAEDN